MTISWISERSEAYLADCSLESDRAASWRSNPILVDLTSFQKAAGAEANSVRCEAVSGGLADFVVGCPQYVCRAIVIDRATNGNLYFVMAKDEPPASLL